MMGTIDTATYISTHTPAWGVTFQLFALLTL